MRARRTDRNHAEIAAAFERCGYLVHHTIGDWDLTVCRGGQVLLIEVKDGKKSPSKTRLTERSAKLVADGWPIERVESVDDVLRISKGYR